MTRVGLPNDFWKFQPIQPLARFFGSFIIRPFFTGAGKPIETASKSQSAATSLILATNSFGLNFGPESNFRFSSGEIIIFTWVPPISTTRIFFMDVLSDGS